MQIRFPMADIPVLAGRYVSNLKGDNCALTDELNNEIFPCYRRKGFLTKSEFMSVCGWKSPRSRPWCELNSEEDISEVSRIVLNSTSERIRIQTWLILEGVKWPTASVFLHYVWPEKYPILDFRALWSLGYDEQPTHNLSLWNSYAGYCRDIAEQAGVTMRQLDQSLWRYSKENMPQRQKEKG